MLNHREREGGEDSTKKMLCKCREREEGEDTAKKVHASAKEKKGRTPPRRC